MTKTILPSFSTFTIIWIRNSKQNPINFRENILKNYLLLQKSSLFSCSNIFKCIIYENTWENLQPYFSCISLYPTKYQIRLAWQLSFLFDTSLCVLWYSCNEITMDRVQLFSTEISENKLSTKICHICNKFSWSHDSLSVYLLSGLQTEPMNLSLDEST